MTSAIIPSDDPRALIGAVADDVASRYVFEDYPARKAAQTLRRQRADLALFAEYLSAVKIDTTAEALMHDPDAWRGLTWGIVAGYARWLLQQGYAVGSVNVRLSTVRTYAQLAMQAGALTSDAYALIQSVKGYRLADAKHVDAQRSTTRRGVKKAEAVTMTTAQRRALKAQPDTPQGRRDAVLMCLLLDHGLRCGEIAALTVDSINLQEGTIRFYRQKVNKTQTHKLTPDTARALRAWFDSGDAPAVGFLLRASVKSGQLTKAGMSERAITKRVEFLGRQAGIVGLSAHDGRHSWATTAARKKTDPFALKEAGGWNSLKTVDRYIEAAKIANEGVNLD